MLISDTDLNHDNVYARAGFIYSKPHPHLTYRYDPVAGTFESIKSIKVGLPKNGEGAPWALLKSTTERLDAASGGRANIRTTTIMTATGPQSAIEVWAWVPEQNSDTIGMYLNHMLLRESFEFNEIDMDILMTGEVEVVNTERKTAPDQI